MKTLTQLIIVSAFLISLVGCKKASTVTLNERVDSTAVSTYQGSFSGVGSENVSGKVKIFLQDGKYTLQLENFSTSNGPDLKVYLSQKDNPSGFISLGDLKSTNGNQLYTITGSPDFAIHKYVLIHCQRYNHLFGRALLSQ